MKSTIKVVWLKYAVALPFLLSVTPTVPLNHMHTFTRTVIPHTKLAKNAVYYRPTWRARLKTEMCNLHEKAAAVGVVEGFVRVLRACGTNSRAQKKPCEAATALVL